MATLDSYSQSQLLGITGPGGSANRIVSAQVDMPSRNFIALRLDYPAKIPRWHSTNTRRLYCLSKRTYLTQKSWRNEAANATRLG